MEQQPTFPLTSPRYSASRLGSAYGHNRNAETEDAARRIARMTSRAGSSIAASSVGVASGLTIGATVGFVAGPPGMLAGAVVGAIVGACAGLVYNDIQHCAALQDDRLDREIGVTSGNLGEANGLWGAPMNHLSAASLGVGGTTYTPMAEGPMSPSMGGGDE